MASNIPLIVFPVKEPSAAKKFYNAYLQTEPYVDGEYYIGYKLSDMEIGLDPNGKDVVTYVDVDDIDESIKTLKEVGGTVVMEPKNVGAGLMVAQVKVEDNVMGLRQAAK